MRIAVIGANSEIGKKIVLEAEKQGIKVTCFVENFENIAGNGRIVIKSFEDILAQDLTDCHYVIDPLSFFCNERFSSDLLPVWHLLEIMKNTEIKLMLLGLTGFLYTDSSRTKRIYEEAALPLEDDRQAKKERVGLNAYKRLRECGNVKWSILCPPLLLDEFAYGSGNFEIGDSILPVGINGDSFISENDFVKALIDVLKRGPKMHDCMSVRALSR